MKHNDKLTFHAFTIKYNGTVSRITTPVKLSVAFDPNTPLETHPPTLSTTALWDTGATKSVITKATVDALGLIPIGVTTVNHVGGSSESNTYLVNILLPNNVGTAGITVSTCENIAGDFGAIIGMDIITQGDLSLTNVAGKTWMTFRIPSIQPIDYVVEANKIKYAGIGRNDPCPCGSGKKFKQCCGQSVPA